MNFISINTLKGLAKRRLRFLYQIPNCEKNYSNIISFCFYKICYTNEVKPKGLAEVGAYMSVSGGNKFSSVISQLFSAIRDPQTKKWLNSKNIGLAGIVAFVAAIGGGLALHNSSGAGVLSQTGGSIDFHDEQPSGAINFSAGTAADSVSAEGSISSGKAKASITINDQKYELNKDGSIHQVVNDSNSHTTVDIKVQNNTSGDQNSFSTSNVTVDSSSSSSSQQGGN